MNVSSNDNELKLAGIKVSQVKNLRSERVDSKEIEIDMTPNDVAQAIELCDQFFDWILNLESLGQLLMVNFQGGLPPYPSMDVEVKLFDVKKTTSWLDLFISGKTLEEIEVIAHMDVKIVVLALVEAIWKEENRRGSSVECLLRAAEVDYSIVKDVLNFVSPGVMKDEKTPFRLFHKLFISPITAAVALLLARAELSKWPLDVNWKDARLSEYSPTEYMEALESLDENLAAHFSTNPVLDQSAIDLQLKEITDLEKEFVISRRNTEPELTLLTAEAASLLNDVQNMRAELQQKAGGRHNQIADAIWPNGLSHSPPRTLEENNQIDAEIADLSRQAERIHVPTTTNTLKLNDLLNFNVGAAVLARREANDSELFENAKVVDVKVFGAKFLLQFNTDFTTKEIDVEDIAYAQIHVNDDFVEGMRVCAKVRHPNPPKHLLYQANGYFSGTISNRPSSVHNYQYLVFFDDNFDEYVSRNDIKIMAVQPLNRGIIDKRKAGDLIRNSEKKRKFVNLYFNSYPDWGLVRLRKSDAQQNNRIAVRHRDGHQWSAIVMDIDRHMCLLRFPPLGRNTGTGANCVIKNCASHYHLDERIYRGSDRFHQVEESIKKHELGLTSLPKLSVGRSRHQRTMLESAVPLFNIEDRPRASDMRRTRNPNTVRKTSLAVGMVPVIRQAHQTTSAFTPEQIVQRKRDMNKYEVVVLSNKSPPKMVYESNYHPKCTSECLGALNKDPSTLKGISPFHIPLLCGWQRLIYVAAQPTSGGRRARRPVVVYRGPCGRPLSTLEEIADYLNSTMCELTIDLFAMEPNLRTNVIVKVDARDQVLADFTQGLEAMPITVVNTVDTGPLPDIQYSAQRFAENEEVDGSITRKEFCTGCSCTDDCRNVEKCECQILTRTTVERLARDLRPSEKCRGYEFRRIFERIMSGIYECNDACKCWSKRCFNRVAQQQIKVPLQLFKTAQCGWGVRTLVDLPAGYFIANYNGALLTDHLADKLKDRGDEYFAELDLADAVEIQKHEGGIDLLEDKGMADLEDESESDTQMSRENSDSDGYCSDNLAKKRKKTKQRAESAEPTNSQSQSQSQPEGFGANWDMEEYFGDKYLFIVDAKKRGNIGRFLNHSCDPNVVVQHVFIDTHDIRLPWISFFTKRFVKAGEELRWDYNYTFDETSQPARVACYCGAKDCRRRLL